MAFTEFYCQNGGSNLNAGSTNNNSAAYTSTNGNWNGSTIFTPTDGSNPSSTVSVGDFASVYLDAASNLVFIARVTAVQNATNGTITVSSTVKAGSAPTSGASGRTIKVGGAWKGPNGSVGLPFSLSGHGALLNTSGNPIRINLKNDQTYSISSAISQASSITNVTYQGYSSSPGDTGRATIDGGSNAIQLLNQANSSTGCVFADLVFSNNGSSGANDALIIQGASSVVRNVVVHDIRGNGINCNAIDVLVTECETYLCNKSNTSQTAAIAFTSGGSGKIEYTVSHDNSGSNGDGFFLVISAGKSIYINNCISDSNAGKGINALFTGSGTLEVENSDLYNNTGDGVLLAVQSGITCRAYIKNSNFIKNGGWGINTSFSGTGNGIGEIDKNGFGAGTQANGSGTITSTLFGIVNTGTSVTYPSNVAPYVDAPNGDFRINNASAYNAGRGTFTQTAASYAGTIGYPDIGAAQALPAAAQSSHCFST